MLKDKVLEPMIDMGFIFNIKFKDNKTHYNDNNILTLKGYILSICENKIKFFVIDEGRIENLESEQIIDINIVYPEKKDGLVDYFVTTRSAKMDRKSENFINQLELLLMDSTLEKERVVIKEMLFDFARYFLHD
jgi:hypothetical protein